MEQFKILPILIIPGIQLISYLILKSLHKLVPTEYQLIGESLYGTILDILEINLDKKNVYYLPYISSIFIMIFISNFLGLIPYSVTASTEFIITLGLACTTLIGVIIHGILIHGYKKFMYLFLPSGTPAALLPLLIPLEILAYITRTLSQGLRLAVNLITGHILVKVLMSFVPKLTNIYIIGLLLGFQILFLSLEILIAYLQAYIFIFITIITIKDIL